MRWGIHQHLTELAPASDRKVQALSVRRVGGHDHGRCNEASYTHAEKNGTRSTGKNDLPHARMDAVGADEQVALCSRSVFEYGNDLSSIARGEFL